MAMGMGLGLGLSRWYVGGILKTNLQGYASGIYSGFVAMWGLGSDPTLDYDASMRVYPDTFPVGTIFSWRIGSGALSNRIRGYNHVDIGNYDDSANPTAITPRQVYTITDLAVNVDYTFTGDPATSVLVECWLGTTGAAHGAVTQAAELGFFPKVSAATITYMDSVIALGTFTDRNGIAWTGAEGVGSGGPFYMFRRTDNSDFHGDLDFSGAFAFLIAAGKVIGDLWYNGVANGIEPYTGAGSYTILAYSQSYSGAARVPWTISNLTATPKLSSAALLAYTAAPGATSHEYRINGAGSWITVPANKIVTGLTPSTSYTFEVRGVNTTGNGAASNSAGATTAALALPAIVAAGTLASGTGDVSPGLPAGWAADDIHLLAVQTSNQAVSTPSGYTALANANKGVAGAVAATAVYVFWRRAVAGDAAPTVVDPGDHAVAQVIGVRGAIASGTPNEINTTNVDSGSAGTNPSVTVGTTLGGQRLVLGFFSHGTDTATPQYSGWTAAGLANVTECSDIAATDGNGGGIGIVSGEKATAGAVGAISATLATSARWANVAFAVIPG